jgi:predicted ester cyclase
VITATWQGPFEGVDCTGRKITFTGFSMYTFRDGKLASNRDCWDYTAMMRQFGVLAPSLRSLR